MDWNIFWINTKFLNNYLGFIRNISKLEAMPLDFFYSEIKNFILPNFEVIRRHSRVPGLAFILNTIIKLDLKSEETEQLKELIFREIVEFLANELKTEKQVVRSNFLNYFWCLCVDERFDKVFWQESSR